MPGLDKTGPMGQGAQTGRKMGRCNQENEAFTEELPRGEGFRPGQGRKMRLGSGWNTPGDRFSFSRGKGRRK